MKRPPEERDRILKLIRAVLVGGAVVVALGVLAVVVGVFDPSREERAADWIEREYDAEVGTCEELGGERVVCDMVRVTAPLRERLGPLPPEAASRVCLFVLDDASVVLRGWASGDTEEPCGPETA